ncbi:AEC family transporter [Sutterella sp.]|uniref:AEC family transporter n=1 Tax=Sutterella sp. TaxID=1981025 RepID=UPI0026E00791|nr:AEC family transporter [Sutterella sp.]MDO5532234.1 AEC family transporter [Sutterella sp.]
MEVILNNFLVALPLFALVGLGVAASLLKIVTHDIGAALSRFAFAVVIPVLLFRIMSNITQKPAPDWKIVIAFFGACFIVYFVSRFLARTVLGLTAEERCVFGIGAVFSNNVFLGLPLALELLGESAAPAVAVVFSLNDFIMWTAVTISIEMLRSSSPNIAGTLTKGLLRTLKNPIIIAIILGFCWSLTGLTMPAPMQKTVDLMSAAATPTALFAVGVGLTQYRITTGLKTTAAITFLKLGIQPLAVYTLCRLVGLGYAETQAICLLACLPVGVNVYIMATQFNVLQGPTANSLLVTTVLASVTMPVIMSLLGLL